jgi:replicative DNA helicase
LFVDAVEVLSALPILVDDTPTLTPAQLRARCRQIKARMGLDLVIVDYLQLMSGERRFENRQVEVSAISRQLKALAKELNIPVLAAAQLSRAVEQRGEKRPQLSDLRDSGSIEQDADVVMFLFKDEMKSGSMILEVAKHRSGPTGILPLTFHAQHTKFEDPAKR